MLLSQKLNRPLFEENGLTRLSHSRPFSRHAVETHDARLLADAAETLLFLMQQHNSKEETVLYPMADRMLSDDLFARFNDLKASG